MIGHFPPLQRCSFPECETLTEGRLCGRHTRYTKHDGERRSYHRPPSQPKQPKAASIGKQMARANLDASRARGAEKRRTQRWRR